MAAAAKIIWCSCLSWRNVFNAFLHGIAFSWVRTPRGKGKLGNQPETKGKTPHPRRNGLKKSVVREKNQRTADPKGPSGLKRLFKGGKWCLFFAPPGKGPCQKALGPRGDKIHWPGAGKPAEEFQWREGCQPGETMVLWLLAPETGVRRRLFSGKRKLLVAGLPSI